MPVKREHSPSPLYFFTSDSDVDGDQIPTPNPPPSKKRSLSNPKSTPKGNLFAPTAAAPSKNNGDPSTSITTTSPKTGRGSHWSPEEDALILSLRSRKPPAKWDEIAVALGGGRTRNMARMRHYNQLRYDDNTGKPLNEAEKELLKRALKEYESPKEKWWFVAKKYEELKSKVKGDGECREIGKVAARKWCEALGKE